ncbi:MAG TPA: hypothetical protein VLH79_03540, partial [Chthonomonadales bacterium]|nr:hypothetical protein [Chthonomonadales bacterium]
MAHRSIMRASVAAALLALGAPLYGQEASRSARPASVNITIYNQNFALVKERRPIELVRGRNRVVIEDVASQIDPTSVHFKSVTAPAAVVVREQNYLYDLINPTTLLNKSVGRKVTIRQNLGNGVVRELTGTIVTPVSQIVARTGEGEGLGAAHAGLVVRLDDGKLVLNPVGEVVLHEMPAGLIPRPQLVWLVDSEQAGTHDAEVSYLTQGVTWRADYVATLSADDTMLDLTGWVTLDNRSGATYENASLQLIAGDVRRIQPQRRRGMMEEMALAAPGAAGREGGFQQEAFFEYHLYTLEGTTTVRDNEQKQMTLLTANRVPATKRFIYEGRRGFWGIGNPNHQPGEGFDTSQNRKVNIIVEVKNAKPAMGIPLPKGRVRLYKADSRGALQFVGEDEIDHTPQNETLKLYVGDSFDIVGEHKRTDFNRIGPREVEESFEISIRNRRKEPAQVTVVEHAWADWRITARSHPYVRKDARTIEFP